MLKYVVFIVFLGLFFVFSLQSCEEQKIDKDHKQIVEESKDTIDAVLDSSETVEVPTPDTPTTSLELTNKVIPESIKPQAEKALSYYPELKDVPITFKFKKDIKKSTMQAQPKFSSFFKSRKNRAYVILISEKFKIEDDSFNILDVEDEIMTGWFGHELGHIMDYRERSNFGMLIFGFKYLYSKAHIQEVERTADAFAIKHGMVDYILATKDFILNNSKISPEYKARIQRLYLSPEEIMEMVNELEESEIQEEVDKEMEKQS